MDVMVANLMPYRYRDILVLHLHLILTIRHHSILTIMALQLVKVSRIANKVVDRSYKLRERYLEELEQLMGPQKWALVKEISRIAEEHTEKVAFAALVQKEIIDSWTDDDYKEMGINKAQVETELNYSSVLPLADIYTNRKKEGKGQRSLRGRMGEKVGR